MSESISIKIVSATYGPCEGIKLDTGESTNDEATRIPISRDVAPFLRALLSAARTREERYWTTVEGDLDVNDVIGNDMEEDEEDVGTDFPQIVRVQPTVGGMTKSSIFLLGGRLSMNSCFGDPCPGVSKRLQVHYVITEADVTEVHHSSFAEHERVILRRRVTFFQDDSQLKLAVEKAATNRNIMNNRSKLEDIMMMDSTENQRILQAHRMGRSQSIAEFESAITTKTIVVTPWRLRSAVSEIVLPLVLPFLKLHERVSCRLICRCWLHVVRDFGVAKTIDSNEQDFSRSFLRGILSHSHSSLDSLYLTRFESLQKEDLHPALPHLRKLRSLDITRCHNLDDSTMMLISKSVYQTLEVLYIKGLTKVSDVGFKAICSSCNKLEVLDMSYVPITDEGGKAIQQLKRLRALFLRDNYQLTNQRYVKKRKLWTYTCLYPNPHPLCSIDVITEKCTRLAQLTLWGCIRMQHLRVPSINSFKKLVILNLWGCHNLNDEASHSLNDMPNLKSLIVSECHRLTDRFVVSECFVDARALIHFSLPHDFQIL